MTEPAAFDVSCVVHVHTTYSDGTATVPEVLDAARAAGVDALLVTDHDTLGARRAGWEGMHAGVFLLVGTEVSPKQGHYLAFGVDAEVPHEGRTAVQIAEAVRAARGVGFAAHPFSTGDSMLVPSLARRIVLPHGWPALDDPDGCDGIELWSLTTDAAERGAPRPRPCAGCASPRLPSPRARRHTTFAAGTPFRPCVASRPSAGSMATRPGCESAAASAPRSRTPARSACSEPIWSATAGSEARPTRTEPRC